MRFMKGPAIAPGWSENKPMKHFDTGVWQIEIGGQAHKSYVRLEIETDDFERLIKDMRLANRPHLISMLKKTVNLDEVMLLVEYWLRTRPADPAREIVMQFIAKAIIDTNPYQNETVQKEAKA